MANVSVKYLIIGGGAAAAQGSVGVREVDSDGSVLIVCSEPRYPYDRPPLSKGFLKFKPASPEDVESKDPSFYESKNIEVRRGVEAKTLDCAAQQVGLSDGTTVHYDKLLLATGASPKPLAIKGAQLQNVLLFRSVEDAESVRRLAKESQNVVLIGAGFIGMEVGASLRQIGNNVTFVAPSDQPWSKFASPITGNFLRAYFENEGVNFLLEDSVTELVGDGKVSEVRTKAGRAIPADLVVIGIGVQLNVDLAKGAGLDLFEAGGVWADEFLRTSDPNVYVAGDIAAYFDEIAGKRWHVEHYMNARWTGNQAGRNMAGANEPYKRVAYFFSDMFDLSMALRGDPTGGHPERVLGDVDTGEFVELYADGEGLVRMALGITRDGDRYDPMVEGMEKIVMLRHPAKDVQPADVGLT